MKLKDLWKEKDVTLSFEAFPPKKDSDFVSVALAVAEIARLKPAFVSVTYGAGGGTSAYTPPDRQDRPGPGRHRPGPPDLRVLRPEPHPPRAGGPPGGGH